jgi:hypothetical protein
VVGNGNDFNIGKNQGSLIKEGSLKYGTGQSKE